MLRRTLLSLAVSVLVLGCGDDDPASPAPVLTGTWNLVTVSGQPLPFTLPGTNEVVTAESFTILSTGRFTMSTTFRFTINGQVTSESIPDGGTYVVNGSTVTFKYDSDGSTDVAAVNGNTMTLEDIGQVWTYRRN